MSVSGILVTGSESLVGGVLCRLLADCGYRVERLDLRAAHLAERGDIRDEELVRQRIRGCSGVVNLAAVSRVAAGERDPELCWQTNVIGTEVVMRAAAAQPVRPWVLQASSCEVYGSVEGLPVREDAPMRPMNLLGRSKAAAERVTLAWRRSGIDTAVARLANVYGSVSDHGDRVAPAFARAAAEGGVIRVCGREQSFDFTHVDDIAVGLLAMIESLQEGEILPPIHLVTGVPTTLGQLAEIAAGLSCGSKIVEVGSNRLSNARFVGDPARSRELLGWWPHISVEAGMGRLVEAFRQQLRQAPSPEVNVA